MFKVLGYTDNFVTCDNTSHVMKRSKRLQIAQRLISEESAKIIKIAIVNKGHENGNEAHIIYNNGIVKVYNANSHKFITVLIAREPQIKRYQIRITKTMHKKIKSHIEQGYNEIAF